MPTKKPKSNAKSKESGHALVLSQVWMNASCNHVQIQRFYVLMLTEEATLPEYARARAKIGYETDEKLTVSMRTQFT